MAALRTPVGLSAGGRKLWTEVSGASDLDAVQQVTLLEACRAKDRLDKLDELLRGDAEAWATLTHDLRTEDYELKIDSALASANTTANLMKQLLAALRLPDEASGKRPQQRGGARGAYRPTAAGTSAGATISTLEYARRMAESDSA